MPRRIVEDDQRRRREVAILLTGPESRVVGEAAARRSMRVSGFIRQAALAAAGAEIPDIREEPRQLEPDPGAVALRREVRRLGSNLNQLLKLVHQGRPTPQLRAAVEELRATVQEALSR